MKNNLPTPKPFSPHLQKRLNNLFDLRKEIRLGGLTFDSPLILAPMAGICNSPFRLLMQDLGAGGSVSELISCDGILHRNQRTLKMMEIRPQEKCVGLQLFGEKEDAMAEAAQMAQETGAHFIDINMGCPVRKVVTKGAGSALLREPNKLYNYLSKIKKSIRLPLTIKIRTGWDQESINAHEIIKVASDCGVEFVAIHGRTRLQAYSGKADWDYLERLTLDGPLPLIGNGDLHTPVLVKERLEKTKLPALMIARGCLRNPFIFLESLSADLNNGQDLFTASDYWEIINRLYFYLQQSFEMERVQLIQIRKLIVWFAAGFPFASSFRQKIFSNQNLADNLQMTEDYFLSVNEYKKQIDPTETFLNSGHG